MPHTFEWGSRADGDSLSQDLNGMEGSDTNSEHSAQWILESDALWCEEEEEMMLLLAEQNEQPTTDQGLPPRPFAWNSDQSTS